MRVTVCGGFPAFTTTSLTVVPSGPRSSGTASVRVIGLTGTSLIDVTASPAASPTSAAPLFGTTLTTTNTSPFFCSAAPMPASSTPASSPTLSGVSSIVSGPVVSPSGIGGTEMIRAWCPAAEAWIPTVVSANAFSVNPPSPSVRVSFRIGTPSDGGVPGRNRSSSRRR